MKYEEIYDDWKYLFDIGDANDMTGGYVDQEDLSKLLKSPCKKTAASILKNQIEYWFDVGLERDTQYGGLSITEIIKVKPRIAVIAEKYLYDLEMCPCPFVKV